MRKLKEETVYKKKPCCNIAYLSDHRYLLSCLSLRVFTCYVRYLPQNLSIYRIYIYMRTRRAVCSMHPCFGMSASKLCSSLTLIAPACAA